VKREGNIVIAAWALLAAVLLAGAAAAQGGSLTFTKNGNIVTISGNTNLAPGDRLLVNVVSASFTPTGKGAGGGFGGAAGTAIVQPGSPLNTYSFDVDVSAFPPDEYLVSIESVETTFTASGEFVLPWTPVPTQPPAIPASGTTTIPQSVSPLTTVPVQGTSPTKTPVMEITALAGIAIAIRSLLQGRPPIH
jgi:hypothetical protein